MNKCVHLSFIVPLCIANAQIMLCEDNCGRNERVSGLGQFRKVQTAHFSHLVGNSRLVDTVFSELR